MSDFTPQQTAAINGSGNLLVVAGAGTGKTHTLINRCLRLVTEAGVSLENLLMVTFTEAAAAELRARLREELLRRHAAHPADDRLAEQLALLDTARISTLHGFCLQLAREHFHQLGLDPQFGVLDEQQTRPLQREALDALLERNYSGTDAAAFAVRQLVRTVGRGLDQPIRHLVLKLHAYTQSLPDPSGWLDAQQKQFEQTEPVVWRKLFLQGVADWRDEWSPRLEIFRGATPGVELCRTALGRLTGNFSAEAAAEVLRVVVHAKLPKEHWPSGSVGKVRDHIDGMFEDAEFLAALTPTADGPDPLAQDWEWARQQMLALLALTREFSTDFAARKRELGGVDFADLEQLALRALALPGVAESWRTRLEHIFVDEYQDINAAQDAILTALSRPAPDGNRFLVGDVKQSIYRFRLANPRIFQAYQKAWSHSAATGKALSLTENFRSREAILDFVNPLFGALMRADVGGVAYEDLDFGAAAKRTDLAANGRPVVELHIIAKSETNSETTEDGATDDPEESPDQKSSQLDLLATEREARLVARKLRELYEAKHPIWDKAQKKFRPVTWSDMAVLLRSPGGRAETFAMEFSKAGVPLSAARDGFFASLEVSDLVNLLKLLDNPLQDVPLVAVLRSPLVGLTLEELAEIRAAGGRDLFWTALQQVQAPKSKAPGQLVAKVTGFLEQFARWRELVRQTSLTQTLETALGETHFEELLLAGERGVERANNVRRLLDLARQFDPYQRQGLYRFLRFVQQQEDEDLDAQPAVLSTGDAVRLISIHKSKGLEFPIVVLAGLGTKFNEQDLNAQVLLHETLGLCPKISPPEAEQSYPSIACWLARRSERGELRGEELRLFYVALTRARDRLLLVGTTARQPQNVRWESAPEALSRDAVIKARSHLDWLLEWLPAATSEAQWRDDRSGGNELLEWTISEANDAVFADIGVPKTSGAQIAPTEWPAPETIRDLQARLEWNYPFRAATTEPAKATVSALRRRVADEMVEETAKLWDATKGLRGRVRTAGKLSAAARGTAHHAFLQNVPLDRVSSQLDLRNAAEEMHQAGMLTDEELAALDFAALGSFWDSDFGQELRAVPEAQVHRELPFTARLSAADLRALGLPLADTGLADNEFIVVQGVADLVVLHEQELWLLDFKTDQVDADGLAAKARFYEPQLQLYALALSRIYQRKVTDCRLWFLGTGTGVKVPV